MNGAGPLWVIGWLTAAILTPAITLAALARLQDHRDQREAARRRREHLDAAFCAAHGINWHDTAAEKTP